MEPIPNNPKFIIFGGSKIKREDVPKTYIQDNSPMCGSIHVEAPRIVGSVIPQKPSGSEKPSRPSGSEELEALRTRIFIVTKVVNPHLFYVQFVTDINNAGQDRASQLQDFYNDPVNSEKYKLRGGRVFLEHNYVCKLAESGLWHPCIVLRIHFEIRTCSILLINLNEVLDHVRFDDLFELKIDFKTWSERSISCSLLDVVPPNGLKEWPKESIEGFKKLTRCKLFFCSIATKQIVQSTAVGAESVKMLKLEVVLLGKFANATVNTQLCIQNLADSTGPSSRRVDVDYNPFLKRQDAEYLSDFRKDNFFKSSQKLDPSPTNENEASKPRFYNDWILNRSYVQGFLAKASEKVREHLGIYRITSFESPSCFYVQELQAMPRLFNMCVHLTDQLINLPLYPFYKLSEGDFVGVLTDMCEGGKMYFRGVVKTLEPYNQVMVLLIDLGGLMSTSGDRIQLLPSDFLKIPGFAFRMHLDIPLSSRYNAWPKEAIEISKIFVGQIVRSNLLCYIFNKDKTEVVLDLLNLDLKYNHEEHVWEPKNDMRMTDKYLKFNSKLVGHPVLTNLSVSSGVDILLQSKNNDTNGSSSSPYHVDKLSELLITHGFALSTLE